MLHAIRSYLFGLLDALLTASITIYGLVHAYQIGTLHPTLKGRKNYAFKTELTV